MSTPQYAERFDWMITHSGRKVHLLEPRPSDLELVDIAHALAHLCRFGGHVRKFYSVAQHSVLVSELVPHRFAAAALLHDAAEAYIGDVIRPLKRELAEYAAIEARFDAAVSSRFGVDLSAAEIKDADRRALLTERLALQPESTRRALSGELRWIEDEKGLQPDRRELAPLLPLYAKDAFLARARELGIEAVS